MTYTWILKEVGKSEQNYLQKIKLSNSEVLRKKIISTYQTRARVPRVFIDHKTFHKIPTWKQIQMELKHKLCNSAEQ